MFLVLFFLCVLLRASAPCSFLQCVRLRAVAVLEKGTPPSRGSAPTCARGAPAQRRSGAAGPVAQPAARAAAPACAHRPTCPRRWRRSRPCQWRELPAGPRPPNTASFRRKRPTARPKRRPWLGSRPSPTAASVGPRARGPPSSRAPRGPCAPVRPSLPTQAVRPG